MLEVKYKDCEAGRKLGLIFKAKCTVVSSMRSKELSSYPHDVQTALFAKKKPLGPRKAQSGGAGTPHHALSSSFPAPTL